MITASSEPGPGSREDASRPTATALELTDITKSFGATQALQDVSISIKSAEVHALLGENGAGKSTLMHIANGMLRADSGSIVTVDAEGHAISRAGFDSPRAARAAGIGMVHQHFTSIPAFTVAENIALTAGWRETGMRAEERAAALAGKLGLPVPVREHVDQLTVQLRQRVEIVKALAANARILLLDEPTAVLAPPEISELLRFMREFAEKGGAVVLITHKLDEVLEVADRVTVLRKGKVVLSDTMVEQTHGSLSRAMVGVEPVTTSSSAVVRDEVLVRAEGAVCAMDGAIGAATFSVRGGEIVGIVAVEGNGQRTLMRAIASVDGARVIAGDLIVNGPVAFIAEDRTTEGLIDSFTLTENLLLSGTRASGRLIDWASVRSRTSALLDRYDVRPRNAAALAATLSGGNQQKFILARALEGAPRVIVAENPTRGLDVLAASDIHDRLREAATGGAAVLVHSSDLDEVLALATRLLVIARGEASELPIDASRETIGEAMLGVRPAA